ncbi:unnamed protein product [Caenorhabditis bovis]|uniref:Mcm6 C-terminal winged-helix domain-containing protein n=1 Tax=Caenorhabditis bovis TaxID=2654633 RepID=A0A8S1F675_9PELO|nr:unnamed protein product [Caenorhabditis bovis]
MLSETQSENEDAENLKPKIYPAKLQLKYEDYKKMSDVLILHMRAAEDKLGNEDYGDLGSEEDYLVQKTVCERVNRRLIHDERVLLEVEQGDESTLCVHPDYAVVPQQVFRGDGTDGPMWSVEELLKQYETNSSWVVDAKTRKSFICTGRKRLDR